MNQRIISATQFKAQCLKLIDGVAERGEVLIVTKHNRPVVRVIAANPGESLRGSVQFLVSDEELVTPLGETWQALE